MSVRYDAAHIQVDWVADFVGWRSFKLDVTFTDQNDPLLLLILERYNKKTSEQIAALTGQGEIMF